MPEHTPAPWFCHKTSHHCFDYRITDKDKLFKFDYEQNNANALLIEAAPDLLAALGDAWYFIENVTEDDPQRNEKFFALRAKVRDAFDKVRGENS